MNASATLQVDKDLARHQMRVTRTFFAPLAQVWRAWTEAELLDRWWAPKPWRAETKRMDFREGGEWLYAMVGPEGERHWGRVNYQTIRKEIDFTAQDCFCDAEGVANPDMPSMGWHISFRSTEQGTEVSVVTTYPSREAMEQLLSMGMEEGFAAALTNLDALLEEQTKLA